jgi:regulatory protein
MGNRISKEMALQKLRHYCAYQERCHAEVREKAYTLGMHKSEVEELVSALIQDDYLNEERFAMQFAGSKFRMKQWGRVKIQYELKQKQISPYCIKKALAVVDEEEYMATLEKLAAAKTAALKGETNMFIKKRKLQDYLLQKGYESHLVAAVVSGKGV